MAYENISLMKAIQLPLYCGSLYFLLVFIVHAIGLKIPGLFIYFNVPSYAYQDRIISMLSFGWSVFFFQTAKFPEVSRIKSIIVIGLAALFMLTCNNLVTDFSALSDSISPVIFHLETGILALYWFWLLWAYRNFKQGD